MLTIFWFLMNTLPHYSNNSQKVLKKLFWEYVQLPYPLLTIQIIGFQYSINVIQHCLKYNFMMVFFWTTLHWQKIQ